MSRYGALAPWYDALTGDVPYPEFVDFYEEKLKKRGIFTGTILDLACGTGTVTRLLAARGYEMIAVDASPDMLAEAAEKAASLPPEATPPLFLCQDMGELDLYGTVDAAVCCLDGINYVPPEKLGGVFRRLRLFIRPGGLFIFDIHSPQRLRALDGGAFVDEAADMLCLWRAEFDAEENALRYDMDLFTQNGALWRRDEEEHLEYAHAPGALISLLELEGFGEFETVADGPQGALGRIFIIARRGI